MSDVSLPDYRVRLFLSVDLTGSTAFKSKNNSFTWLKAFQHFYAEFPKLFVEQFERVCAESEFIHVDERASKPKIWKTIGDEILFVNRVYSLAHLVAYVTAFSDALHKFGEQADKIDGLNTKGNGWLAAFPSPNCSIGIDANSGKDPMSGVDELPTEAFEYSVDDAPRNFDFLGKGIDGGFRISRNSTIDTFTISPALAFMLTKAAGNPDATGGCTLQFRFHEPQTFKGVVNGRPYPIISIDTVRSDAERELNALEAQLLEKADTVLNLVTLKEYLEKYIDHHSIEKPVLKLAFGSDDLPPPEHYAEYSKQWFAEKDKSKSDLESLGQEEVGGDDSNIPSVEEAAQRVEPKSED